MVGYFGDEPTCRRCDYPRRLHHLLRVDHDYEDAPGPAATGAEGGETANQQEGDSVPNDTANELYRYIDGEPMLSAAGMALLLGVTEEQMRAQAERSGTGIAALPESWVKAGNRRRKEYEAATGRTDMLGALEYWQAHGQEGK